MERGIVVDARRLLRLIGRESIVLRGGPAQAGGITGDIVQHVSEARLVAGDCGDTGLSVLRREESWLLGRAGILWGATAQSALLPLEAMEEVDDDVSDAREVIVEGL